MKRKFVSCLILLACVIIQAAPVMAATNTTDVTGSVTLAIYEVSTSDISYQGATISWKTNDDATSQVFYDPVYHQDIGDYAYHTDEDTTLISVHSVNLTGLSPATTYHYRVMSRIPGTDFTDVSADYTFTTLASPDGGDTGGTPTGGGGGGAVGGGGVAGEKRITNIGSVTNNSLMLIEDVEALSVDVKAAVLIKKDTIVKNRAGSMLWSIVIEKLAEPPVATTYAEIIGSVYELGPSGTQFEPPAILTLKYREDWLSALISESSLYIATWNEVNEAWERTNCTVDTEANSISTFLSHFSIYTIMADTSPASFTVSDLSISPEEISPGEAITIIALVTNNGGLIGSHNVVLTINGEPVANKKVNLAGGQSEQVTFTREIEEAGTYTAAIDNKSGTFEVKIPEPAESVVVPAAPAPEETAPVKPPSEPSEPVVEATRPPTPTPTTTPTPQPTEEQPVSNVYWWLLGGIIAAVIVIAEVVWLKLSGRWSINIKRQ